MNTLLKGIMFGLFSTLIGVVSVDAQRGDIDRTIRPKGKPAPKVHLPSIQKTTLSNGLNVWLVEHNELPTVALNLVIQAGSDHDPIGQEGLASMTADVLDEGTTTRDALQISEEIESIGASFGVGTSFDGTFATLSTLNKHLDRALDVFADVLTHPTFAEKEFDRLRKQRLTALIQQRDQPPAIANMAYAHILYGPNHPYGNNPSGSEASLNSMTRDDLIRFYETYYRPNNATLLVVGAVKLNAIASRLERALADWKSSDVSPFTVPMPKPVETMQVFLIDKPGSPQSEVRIGYPALARSTEDFFPVLVMNRILGGQFASRINMNLRETRGYTYGASSSFAFRKGVGPFTAQGGIVIDKTDSALVEFLKEIKLMREEGMTADELSFAKKGLIGNFALAFETPAHIAGRLQDVCLYGLSENYYQHYLQNIERVSLEDVRVVANKYLDHSKMAMVVVGDLSKIKEPIEAAGFGEVILCDTDGKPLPYLTDPKK